jgi:protocatechuate 3,4-dioxygenase, alpha subunit
MTYATSALGPSLGALTETTSQTAGPYVHIGLIPHQAGFYIF